MIKHGPVQQSYGRKQGNTHSHLSPIKDFVTKGVADAREKIILQPQACDIKGAKKHNGQQCVIARALNRTLKPEAVAVGRSTAFVVIKGLAVRFALPLASRKLVEEFDSRGRVRNAPIELVPFCKSLRLGKKKSPVIARGDGTKLKRLKKIGVRAVGGGVAA